MNVNISDSKIIQKRIYVKVFVDADRLFELIDSQALEDYHAFIESIHDLLVEYYELTVYSDIESVNHARHFKMIAKCNDVVTMINLDFEIAVTEQYMREGQSQPVTRSIVVNENRFDSYSDAYLEVDKQVEDVVSILKKKKALHSKRK